MLCLMFRLHIRKAQRKHRVFDMKQIEFWKKIVCAQGTVQIYQINFWF